VQKQWEEKNGDGEKRRAEGGEPGFIAGRRGVRCDAAAWVRFCGGDPGLLEFCTPTETSSGFASGLGTRGDGLSRYRVHNDLLVLAVLVFSDRYS
jgi:hypothetical protein